MNTHNCIVVLGATAVGKTRLACHLAFYLNGEIISADSRQVYKKLNIGSGKDLKEYIIHNQNIPYHLINVAEPAEQFYLHQFTEQLHVAFNSILSREKLPVICGGTGLYLDALRKDFSFTQIPENLQMRAELELLAKEELTALLGEFPLHLRAQVDVHSKKRIIRGIEIATYLEHSPNQIVQTALPYRPFYIGVAMPLAQRKERIAQRLDERLNNGLVEEVNQLLKEGLQPARLEQLGLEYKFVLWHLQGKLNKEELRSHLQTAIFQFAKRQSTWFRKMEKEGVKIYWVNWDETINNVLELISTESQFILGSPKK